MKFAKPAARPRVCDYCGLMKMTPWPPPQFYRKKTKKRKSKSIKERSMGREEGDKLLNTLLPFAQQMLAKYGAFHPFGAYMNATGK